MTAIVLPFQEPRLHESYLAIRAPIDRIRGYLALKQDEDDLGPRLYCEYQGRNAGRRFLIYGYMRGDAMDEWSYLLMDGDATASDIAELISDLGISIDRVESASDGQGNLLADLAAVRAAYDASLTKPKVSERDIEVSSQELNMIRQSIVHLKKEAQRGKHDMLVYLLAMAEYEVRELIRDNGSKGVAYSA